MTDGRRSSLARFGVFELDWHARELRKQGRRVHLQDKPFELLALLVERHGDIVTRDELQQRLWSADTHVVFGDGLNTAVKKVRDALGDAADSARFIETIPRRGYRFVASVDWADECPPGRDVPVVAPTVASRGVHWLLGVVAVVGCAFGVGALVFTRVDKPPTVQFQIPAPPGTYFPGGSPRGVISPDGRRVVFLAGSATDRVHRLWIQSLDSSVPHPIPGTEYAFLPTWAPDNRSVAFVSYSRLRTVDLETGRIREVYDTHDGAGVAWSDAATLMLSTPTGLVTIAAGGGRVSRVTTVDAASGERLHVFPQFLPGGRRFLFLALNRNADESVVYLADLDSGRRTPVLATRHLAEFLPPDRLVYVLNDALVAQRFDASTGRLSGAAEMLARPVATLDANGFAEFSISRSGSLIYASPQKEPLRQLVWFDRSGRKGGAIGEPDHIVQFDLSPDGRWVAIERLDDELHTPNLAVLDLMRRVVARATARRANNESPVWAPDSQRFVYARHRDIHQVADLYVTSRDAPEADEPLVVEEFSDHPNDWSPDGRYILFERPDEWGTADLWLMPLEAPRTPTPWLCTRSMEHQAQFSPDGRWVAYTSNQEGRAEVYVRAFRSDGQKWRVSSAGGARPRWSRDGRELFYLSADYRIMAARLVKGDRFDAEEPRSLIDLNHVIAGPYTEGAYAVAPNGQRFLVNTIIDEPGDPPMTVVLNVTSRRRTGL